MEVWAVTMVAEQVASMAAEQVVSMAAEKVASMAAEQEVLEAALEVTALALQCRTGPSQCTCLHWYYTHQSPSHSIRCLAMCPI